MELQNLGSCGVGVPHRFVCDFYLAARQTKHDEIARALTLAS